jgi:hypothetical protein
MLWNPDTLHSPSFYKESKSQLWWIASSLLQNRQSEHTQQWRNALASCVDKKYMTAIILKKLLWPVILYHCEGSENSTEVSPQILSPVQVMRSVAKNAKYGTNNVQLHVSHNIPRYGTTIISFSRSSNDLLQRYFERYLELAMLAHCSRVSGELLQLELGNT